MLFPAKINIIFGISTSNNAGISKIYAEKQVALHSLTFTEVNSGRFRFGYVLPIYFGLKY